MKYFSFSHFSSTGGIPVVVFEVQLSVIHIGCSATKDNDL